MSFLRPTPSPGVVYAALLLLTLVTGLTGSLGAPLVPAIALREEVSLSTAQWALSAPFVVGAVSAPVVGRLGVGRRRRPLLLSLIAVATVGSVVAALPFGIVTILGGRALQGVAFAATPLLFSVARDVLPADRAARAVPTLSVANVAAAGLGYPVTALVAGQAGLAAAFWVAAGIMLMALVVALVTIPADGSPAPTDVDVVGAVLLVLGLSCSLLLVTQAQSWGTGPWSWLTGCLAVALLGGALRHFRRAPAPLVDLQWVLDRRVGGLHLITFLVATGAYVLLAMTAIVVQADEPNGFGLGRSATVVGLTMTVYAVGTVVGNRMASSLATWGPAASLPVGCTVFACADLMLLLSHESPIEVAGAMALGGIASGLSFQALPWLFMSILPAAEVGSALGINVVVRFFGFALGSAVASTLLEVRAVAGMNTGGGLRTAMLAGVAVCAVAAAVALVHARREPTPPAHLDLDRATHNQQEIR